MFYFVRKNKIFFQNIHGILYFHKQLCEISGYCVSEATFNVRVFYFSYPSLGCEVVCDRGFISHFPDG